MIADNDEAGRAHAEAVVRGLAGVAAEARELALPGLDAKGDVSDWIAAQTAAGRARVGLGEELLRLAAAAAGREAAAEDAAASASAAGSGVAAMAGVAGVAAGLRSRRMADVAPEPVSFLWRPYLPLGKLTLLEGDPGQGKSWLTAAIAAGGSLGTGLPGTESFAPFRSLLFTAEDGLADTLRPRLDVLGANVELIYAHDQPVHLDSAEGLAEIEREIRARRPRLVIVDPVVAFLGARTDIYRANEVRSVLAPLADRGGRGVRDSRGAPRQQNQGRAGDLRRPGEHRLLGRGAVGAARRVGGRRRDGARDAAYQVEPGGAGRGVRLPDRRGPLPMDGREPAPAADLLAAETPSEELGRDEAGAFLLEIVGGGAGGGARGAGGGEGGGHRRANAAAGQEPRGDHGAEGAVRRGGRVGLAGALAGLEGGQGCQEFEGREAGRLRGSLAALIADLALAAERCSGLELTS